MKIWLIFVTAFVAALALPVDADPPCYKAVQGNHHNITNGGIATRWIQRLSSRGAESLNTFHQSNGSLPKKPCSPKTNILWSFEYEAPSVPTEPGLDYKTGPPRPGGTVEDGAKEQQEADQKISAWSETGGINPNGWSYMSP